MFEAWPLYETPTIGGQQSDDEMFEHALYQTSERCQHLLRRTGSITVDNMTLWCGFETILRGCACAVTAKDHLRQDVASGARASEATHSLQNGLDN